MRIFQKLNVYQKNTSNPVKQYTYIVKTTRENKEQINSLEKKHICAFTWCMVWNQLYMWNIKIYVETKSSQTNSK